MPRLLIGALLTIALLPAAAQARTTTGNAPRYPDAIVVLGHSGTTGYGSDPAHPYRDAPANSWATGTNPAVKSVYSRILAVNPAVQGHNANLGQDGATLKEFAAQARKAVTLKPAPQLVLVEIADNDIVCDGQDATRYAEFRDEFGATLDTLAKGLPHARIFVVSQWGTFASYVKTLQGLPDGARLKHAGKGPCSMFAPASAAKPGSLVPAHLAYLAKVVDGYHAQLAAACARVPSCRYDGGAAHRIATGSADLSTDLNHLSIAGQAKLAAAEWTAMAGFVDRMPASAGPS